MLRGCSTCACFNDEMEMLLQSFAERLLYMYCVTPDITKSWLTDEGMPPRGEMKLRYVTNKGCAIPSLRSKLAEQTLIGGGYVLLHNQSASCASD